MAFVEIENAKSKTAAEATTGVTASLIRIRSAPALLRMTIKPAVLSQIGWSMDDRVTVLIGTEESHGLIRLRRDSSGAFALKARKAIHGLQYAQLSIGHRPEFANIVAKAEPVIWEQVDDGHIEIVLPKWADATRPKSKAVIDGVPAPMRAAEKEVKRAGDELREANARRTALAAQEEREVAAEFERRLTASPKATFDPALRLTKSEAGLLTILTDRSGKIVPKEAIHGLLYSDDINGGPEVKIIDVMVCKVRDKLAGLPVAIKTHWGVGYTFEGDPAVLMGGAQ